MVGAASPLVPTIDLHSVVTDYCGVGYRQCNITQCAGPHFSHQGFAMLGHAVADYIAKL